MTSRQSYELRSRSGTPFATPPPKSGRWEDQTLQESKENSDEEPFTTQGTNESSTTTFTNDSTVFRESEYTEEYDEDSDDDQVQFIKHNKPRFGKRVHVIATTSLRMLLELINLMWFLLPFVCLVVALVLPRHLIEAIQATPVSLTSPGHNHLNSMSSVQTHMDAMIKEIGHLKKFQEEHEVRMEEIMFLYEQMTKQVDTLADTARTPSSVVGDEAVLNHVSEMIQTALKKAIRDVKTEYKAALQPVEASLRLVTTQATLIENELKTHKDRLTDVEDLVEGSKTQLLETIYDANNPELLERQIESIVATKIGQVQDQVTRVISEESTRHVKVLKAELHNATQAGLDRLIDQKVAHHLTQHILSDGTTGGVAVQPQGRVDYASFAAGARVVRHKSDLTGPKFLTSVVQNLFSPSMFTSKSYNAFPLCSLAGNSCQNAKPEAAISSNVDVGQCWGLASNAGKLTVKLAHPVIPDTVALYHIDPSIAPDFSSAPRDCQVLGLIVEGSEVRQVDLGSFSYQKDGGSRQEFRLNSQGTPVHGVTLRVLSNYGNEKYTCLYRFSVHGERPTA
ncbi:hypothetical protein, variant 1 [Aphanomyces invadans]|uniref:SUN domain-containing protein n=2 Tax=Aphanomyces invadans TaxID=157072 RepID=A0A024UWC5_9STRA|nr:hypothetical protein, variant 1 [Aphanomyces invadans]ETW10270.1 hypothetical protein, variant 1 [Aphanomyces invadans]|eukprot:XP_008861681.1 hypothetical protein, variant 1 [Aphanomyces invadans]